MSEIRLAANLISNDVTGDTGLGHFQMVFYNSQTWVDCRLQCRTTDSCAIPSVITFDPNWSLPRDLSRVRCCATGNTCGQGGRRIAGPLFALTAA